MLPNFSYFPLLLFHCNVYSCIMYTRSCTLLILSIKLVVRSLFLLNLQFYLDTIRWLRYISVYSVYKMKTIFKILTFHQINFKRVLNNNTKTLLIFRKRFIGKFHREVQWRNRIFWMFVVYEVAFVNLR